MAGKCKLSDGGSESGRKARECVHSAGVEMGMRTNNGGICPLSEGDYGNVGKMRGKVSTLPGGEDGWGY